MLYSFLKFWIGLALKIFCPHIVINKPEVLKMEGPLLIASNHPNSFLDAIILDILFQKPIWSLARGDAFKKKAFARILHRLKMLPVYRTREGVENLEHNYTTFAACKELFHRRGLVLIFSEGLCENEWHLRPLKKGTARLAISAWQDGMPLKVLPVGINYSSFKKFGKNVFINFGTIITSQSINREDSDGRMHLAFNQQLQNELQNLVFEIAATDKAEQKRKLSVSVPFYLQILLWLPAAIGLIINAPFYLLVRAFVKNRVKETGHFDSVMLGVLMLSYPIFVLLIGLILYLMTGYVYSVFSILIFPISAWAFAFLKKKTE